MKKKKKIENFGKKYKMYSNITRDDVIFVEEFYEYFKDKGLNEKAIEKLC